MVVFPRVFAFSLARMDMYQSLVAPWSTDLRYATGSMKSRDADEFMDSVIAIATWAEGRM